MFSVWGLLRKILVAVMNYSKMRWCHVKNTPFQRVGFAERHPLVKYPSLGGTCTIIPCMSAVHTSFPGKTGLNSEAFKSGCLLYSWQSKADGLSSSASSLTRASMENGLWTMMMMMMMTFDVCNKQAFECGSSYRGCETGEIEVVWTCWA